MSELHQNGMLNYTFQIDELLREIGVAWINEYESNMKVRDSVKKLIGNHT